MTQASYKVLARRYRPARLSDLVGQENLQRTLTQAIEQDHLPHAILLHGIRGVGKTTTARIIARALNCKGVDGNGGITPDPCGVCPSCVDIQNDRHLDVVEIDAASHTSVENIRDVIESARYKAVKGRFKIFIIDEVHMLSKSAFNALLKTLEEPPSHVKFIFATTELRKIPDTILSRCMRIDLQIMRAETILPYLQTICEKEGITADKEALGVIARAADGSMRDSLSLLDQAIALSLSIQSSHKIHITTECVEKMLGATNAEHVFELIHFVFQGHIQAVITKTETLFVNGSDPLLLLQDILEGIYWLTCFKVNPAMAEDPTWSIHKRSKGSEIISGLELISLARAWQILSKGYEEVQKNPLQRQACLMVLLRLCHVGAMPSLEKIVEAMGGGMPSSSPTLPPSSTLASNHTTEKNAIVAPSLHQIQESDENSALLSDMTTSTRSLLDTKKLLPEIAFDEPLASSTLVGGERNNETKTHLLHQQNNFDSSVIPSGQKINIETFKDLIEFLKSKNELLLAATFHQSARLISYEPGFLAMNLDMQKLKLTPTQLKKTLEELTQLSWTLKISNETIGTTIREEEEKISISLLNKAKENLFVKELLEIYPLATLTMEKIHAPT